MATLKNPTRDAEEAQALEREAELANILDHVHLRGMRALVNHPTISAYKNSRKNGVIIPESALEHMGEFGIQAEILKISPELEDPAEGLVVGNTVLLTEFAGKQVYLQDDTPFWIVGDSDILAVIENDQAQP